MSYIQNIPTSFGKQLTLMNPADMIKQVMDDYDNLYGVRGFITGSKPLNPNNSSNLWQQKAIDLFTEGKSEEVFEMTQTNGIVSLRLMKPLITKLGCLKCHGTQGYKVGDLRESVSVDILMTPYLKLEKTSINNIHILDFRSYGINIFCCLGAKQNK